MYRSTLGSAVALVVSLAVPPLHAASPCPNVIAFDPAAGQSTADTGFTGLAHDRPIFGNVLRMSIDCAPSTPPCGTCALTGLLPEGEGMFQRCRNDTSIACTEATEVGDCGAADSCAVFLTVPQSAATGGVAGCYTNELTSAVSGSVDVETGALDVTLTYRSRLYTSVSVAQACARCADDPVANDGVRGGTCSEGPRAGLACDGHGPSLAPYDDFGTSSFDCPPAPGWLLGTLDVGPVTFTTGTQSRVLSAASPTCGNAPGRRCFCDTCNNAAAEPCDEDGDCPDPAGPAGPICGGPRCDGGANDGTPCAASSECPAGICKRAGEPTRPNICLDDGSPFACLDTPPLGDGKGVCAAGPVNTVCSNHPNRGCVTIADCDNVPDSCVSENLPCFVTDGTIGDTVTAAGIATPPIADVSEPTALGMLACAGATDASAVNNVIGLPGLTRNVHVGRVVFSEDSSPALACPLALDTCRAPAVPGKSQLKIKDKTADAKDQLQWRWSKGAATMLAELGEPTTTDHYDLCLYDGSGLRASMVIPAGGLCGGRPCWKATSKGFIYKNGTGIPRGITKLTLKSGDAGKASIQVAGKGDLLPLPTLSSLQSPLNVQLRHRASGLCWGASYSAPFKRFTATDLQATD